MVYKFKFTTPEHEFNKPLQGERCKGINKDGSRCKRNVYIGCPYCFFHLKSIFYLAIKKSTIDGAGRGLFACNGTNNNAVVFKKGENIIIYEGEKINDEEIIRRYERKTAPYAIALKKNTKIDASLERSIASHTNHKRQNANCEFIVGRDNGQSCIKIRALKDIRNGQELFVNYGRFYKFNEPEVSFKTYYEKNQ